MKKKKKTPAKKPHKWSAKDHHVDTEGWGKPRQPRWEGRPRWTDADPAWGQGYYGRRPHDECEGDRRTWYIRDRTKEEPKKDYLREAICALAAIQVLVLTYLVLM